MADKRVLVTGGVGFIGSEVARQLATAEAHVLAVDNLVNGKRENLEGLPEEQVLLAEVDIRDEATMADLLKGVDLVLHLACLGVRHSIHSPKENHEVNASATLGLLKLSRSADIPRFVYVSTSEVYGTAKSVPMSEEHPTMPHTVYGGSKLAGEAYTRAYHDTYEYPTIIVRPFNAYGPRSHHEGDSGEVIPKFLLRSMAGREMVIFGDGSQTRDFSYVSDTARGIILAGLSDKAVGQTVNLGYGEEIAINDLAQKVAALVGAEQSQIVHDAPRPGDVLRLFADSDKADDLLDYKAEIPLEDGLRMLKAWYEEQGTSPEQLLEEESVHNWEATTA
ncbi:MAG: SDR family NAD(P)-dependent oxidoreductase [Chloroflexi bacterium]|nr:MAG: SDR family NAD(P)-dependent oxidoreductase [Chloroflexota bacterium]MBL1193192.1 SDR family NAD(P)-dependent oxidoreductase [Chloroflexota bacterium]NOH10486.1 SDR family NAD(P)-dependent oxidoreductase [Chloroflexota bacterium]